MAASTAPPREDIASLEAGLDALDTPVVNESKTSTARRIWSSIWPPLAGLGLLIAIWQLAYTLELKPKFALPSPAQVWENFANEWSGGFIQEAILLSVGRCLQGFAISLVLGVIIGLLLASSPLFRRMFGPLISGLQILPSVAWVPFGIIFVGINPALFLFIVIMGATPSIANGLKSGIDQIPTLYPKVGTMLGTNWWTQVRYVVLPASLPGFVAGLRQGWAFAWRSLMAAEIIVIAATYGFGLGNKLYQSSSLGGDMPGIITYILAMLFVGIVIELCIFAPLEKQILKRRGLLGDKI